MYNCWWTNKRSWWEVFAFVHQHGGDENHLLVRIIFVKKQTIVGFRIPLWSFHVVDNKTTAKNCDKLQKVWGVCNHCSRVKKAFLGRKEVFVDVALA